MSTRKRRGRFHDGLFWQPDTSDGHTRDNPLVRRCPHCRADIGRPCTVAGRTKRDYHPARRHNP